MSVIDSILLSFALAMDCFSIAIVAGIIEKRFHAVQAFVMAMFFGLFQAVMPLIGWALAGMFYRYIEQIAPLIAFLMLLGMGGKMIWESVHDDEEPSFSPTSLRSLLYLSVATSIDALAVGVTFSFTGLNEFMEISGPLLIIALGSFLFTLAGKIIGAWAGKRFRFNAELAGGVILVALGVKILIV